MSSLTDRVKDLLDVFDVQEWTEGEVRLCLKNMPWLWIRVREDFDRAAYLPSRQHIKWEGDEAGYASNHEEHGGGRILQMLTNLADQMEEDLARIRDAISRAREKSGPV